MNIVYENRKEPDNHNMHRANWAFSVILLAFALYFLGFEAKQLFFQKLDYFTSVWNYIDLIAPIGIVIL